MLLQVLILISLWIVNRPFKNVVHHGIYILYTPDRWFNVYSRRYSSSLPSCMMIVGWEWSGDSSPASCFTRFTSGSSSFYHREAQRSNVTQCTQRDPTLHTPHREIGRDAQECRMPMVAVKSGLLNWPSMLTSAALIRSINISWTLQRSSIRASSLRKSALGKRLKVNKENNITYNIICGNNQLLLRTEPPVNH